MTRILPLLMLAVVIAIFGTVSPRFLTAQNLVNIVVQSSSLAIVATGMTFVLLTAGIDLSAGSVMFVSAAIAGKLALAGVPLAFALTAALVVGLLCGLITGLIIVRLKVLAFIATLAGLYALRGLGLYITETRAMNLPEPVLQIGSGTFAAIPIPIWVLLLTVVPGQLILTRTPFGRHVLACGFNVESARRSGVRVGAVLSGVYLISGFCAALGGLVSVAQLGAVSPTFGNQREFAAIAAAVLGGTSLFGGRGSVLPGAFLGAVLIQTVESGLVMVNADPYVYPLVLAGTIFLAVLLDSIRQAWRVRSEKRRIRPLEAVS
ncbi:MAG TPA: ABC transporter permease [Bryobacteraceae bacterium]|nr:ABC transporter permease [Bryobacteraceae bacterium]